MFFNLFSGLVGVVFVFVLIVIVVQIARGAMRWSKNNNSPIIPAPAKLVSKREEVSSFHHASADGIGGHMHYTTTYYATFEFSNGERLELQLDGGEYGLLAEGDEGTLTFQGTRFLGFERQN
ncbi:MAG: DUF2500 domain-containing protein [Oscillospiraceae bacterium]|jgi:hypothetical protein|nr:DUF2500 domain-containing protein [Oscillospiraceae bacterium]